MYSAVGVVGRGDYRLTVTTTNEDRSAELSGSGFISARPATYRKHGLPKQASSVRTLREGEHRDQSVDLQLDGLRRLAEQRGWVIVGEFIDHGISGSKDRRPELDKLMATAHKGKLDAVACWQFDRFARSVRHLVLALDEFRAKGIDFISMNDGIDTSTPTGRFSFTIIAAVAELERELIRERTIAGVQAAKREVPGSGGRRSTSTWPLPPDFVGRVGPSGRSPTCSG